MTKLISSIIVFLIIFSIYILTLCPSLFVGDSGELIAAAYNLGNPHPPGYPLYCIIGKLIITLFPFANIAYRMNLFCALFSSIAAALVNYLILHIFTNYEMNGIVKKAHEQDHPENKIHYICAFTGAFILAVSDTFWSQAVSSEVYGLNNLLFAALLIIIFTWSFSRNNKILYILALIYGISFGNHNILALLSPVFFLYILVIDRDILKNRRVILFSIALFILGVSVYLYLPIRALSKPLINWGDPNDFIHFIDHISRRQYGKLSKFAHTLPMFYKQLKFMLNEIIKEFTFPYVILTVIGIFAALFRNKKVFLLQERENHPGSTIFFNNTGTDKAQYNNAKRTVRNKILRTYVRSILFLIGIFLTSTVVLTLLINYQITPSGLMAAAVFFTPAYVISAVFIAFALFYLFSLAHKNAFVKRVLFLFVVISAFFVFNKNIFLNDLSKHKIAYDYGNSLLSMLPENATIIASGDNAMFSLAYLQLVEKKRPDIFVFDDAGYIFPNIYGRDFRKLPSVEQDRIRIISQKEVILSAKGSAFYTLENTKHDMTGIDIKPFGLLQEVLQAKKTELKSELYYWLGYKISGIEDKNMKKRDYITRNLVAQYFYQFGNFMHSRKNFKYSQYAYDKSNEIGFDNEWIQSNLGIILMNKDDLDNAIKLCEEAVKINPQSAEAHLNLGTAYDSKGLVEKAIAEYKEAIRIKKEYSIAYFNLGNAYMSLGKIKEAVQEYINALTYNPKSVEAHINLGNALDNLKDVDAAIEEYKIAIEINPNSVEAHINLGTAYYNVGSRKQAKEEYEKAIALNPSSVEAHFNLGNIFFVENDLNKAIEQYALALKSNPSYALAYTNLGLAYEKKGEIKKALEFWQKAFTIDKTQRRAFEKLKQYEEKK